MANTNGTAQLANLAATPGLSAGAQAVLNGSNNFLSASTGKAVETPNQLVNQAIVNNASATAARQATPTAAALNTIPAADVISNLLNPLGAQNFTTAPLDKNQQAAIEKSRSVSTQLNAVSNLQGNITVDSLAAANKAGVFANKDLVKSDKQLSELNKILGDAQKKYGDFSKLTDNKKIDEANKYIQDALKKSGIESNPKPTGLAGLLGNSWLAQLLGLNKTTNGPFSSSLTALEKQQQEIQKSLNTTANSGSLDGLLSAQLGLSRALLEGSSPGALNIGGYNLTGSIAGLDTPSTAARGFNLVDTFGNNSTLLSDYSTLLGTINTLGKVN